MPTYRSMTPVTVGQSVYIATPAYESVKAGYALSLANTVAELTRQGIPYSLNIMFGNCHVDDGRNECVRDFLENTDCTDLVFIDADLMWNPSEFLKLIAHKTGDIVAGAYRYKSNSGEYPIGKILGGQEGRNGKRPLVAVSYAPTGFMRIPRGVFEKLSPNYAAKGKLNPSRRFFERRYTERTYDGGDVTFCRKWIAAGGQVLVDPDLTLGHTGEQTWKGNFKQYLGNEENALKHTLDHKDPVPDYKADIHTQYREFIEGGGRETEDFVRLANAWGNKPWAATAALVEAAWRMADALPDDAVILDCGSGLTTLVLAATGRKVVCIEENGEWAEKVDRLLTENGLDVDIKVAPVNCEWYDCKEHIKDFRADMAVIDGPRRTFDGQMRKGLSRLWPLKNGIVKAGSPVLVDDASGTGLPGEWVTAEGAGRTFVAGRMGDINGS